MQRQRGELVPIGEVIDPVTILTEHQFRWGYPPHTYKIKSVDGVVQNESSGVRFSSEVTVIR